MDDSKPKVNIREEQVRREHISRQEFCKDLQSRLNTVTDEFTESLNFINQYPRSVTFFGSARFDENNPYYEKARDLASQVADLGYAVITGGGPGIMEGANRGASQSQEGASLGFNIELPQEQILNEYVEDNINFYYFFTRKVALTFSAEAFVYFPGGFGTLDEFFEILTLIQTKKIAKVPIICVGEGYWRKVDDLIQETLLQKFETINEEDTSLYTITKDDDEILEIIKAAPLREE